MTRGRKPVPTALKKLRGNPGKRALNRDEPKMRVVMPRAPKHLSAVAKEEWRRVGRELLAAGLMTLVDRAALAAYCQTYARWVEAEQLIALEGIITAGIQGVKKHPAVTVAERALEQMKVYMVEFGMTPSSRSRIRVPEKPVEDPFEEFVRRKLEEMPE